MWPAETIRIVAEMPQQGIFLTGIAAHDFYLHYADRLKNIRDLGLSWLRFGPPYSQAHPAKDRFDFEFIDKVMARCGELGLTVIADLLHLGLSDWQHEQQADAPYFQNSYFPYEFATYAAAFAERYPNIQYYTLVNEPFVTAYGSAKAGLSNQQLASDWQHDHQFVRAISNIAKAAIIGRRAIEQVWHKAHREGEPIFVQTESFALAVPAPGSGREAEAQRFNLRRFAGLDLILGHRDKSMQQYLVEQGLSAAEYEWFMEHGRDNRTILGIDHYPSSIHSFEADRVINHDVTEPYKLFELIEEYWDRYPLPLLHTEINAWPEDAITTCQKTYDILGRLRTEGYPVLGMGWYGDDPQSGGSAESHDLLLVGDRFSQLAAQGLPAFDHREARLRMKQRSEKEE